MPETDRAWALPAAAAWVALENAGILGALLPRLAIVGGALAGLTLLGMSLRLFPETTLPERRPNAG